jgi:hypothetical protein
MARSRSPRSTEGIESGLITINGGDIALTSSDDGINISFDDDAGTAAPGGQPGGPGGFGPGGPTTYTGDHYLYIHGGNILVMADGDGIDSNGAIEMTGGVVIVHGPTMNGNSALDYDGVFNISGGFLAAAGSAGMAQAPSPTSSQPSLLLNFSSPLAAGTLIHLQTEGGDSLLTFAPSRAFQVSGLLLPRVWSRVTRSRSTSAAARPSRWPAACIRAPIPQGSWWAASPSSTWLLWSAAAPGGDRLTAQAPGAWIGIQRPAPLARRLP